MVGEVSENSGWQRDSCALILELQGQRLEPRRVAFAIDLASGEPIVADCKAREWNFC